MDLPSHTRSRVKAQWSIARLSFSSCPSGTFASPGPARPSGPLAEGPEGEKKAEFLRTADEAIQDEAGIVGVELPIRKVIIGIGGVVAHSPLPHHPACGSAPGGSAD